MKPVAYMTRDRRHFIQATHVYNPHHYIPLFEKEELRAKYVSPLAPSEQMGSVFYIGIFVGIVAILAAAWSYA